VSEALFVALLVAVLAGVYWLGRERGKRAESDEAKAKLDRARARVDDLREELGSLSRGDLADRVRAARGDRAGSE